MATNTENVRSDRFVDRSITELQQANRSPIDGYDDEVIVPLEKAVEKLIPLISSILKYVDQAKNECNKTSNLLSLNESAAIYLYTMPTYFFQLLNETLRTEDRSALKPWFPFLKIFISALKKLPSSKLTVWRAVALDIDQFPLENDTITWWSVNSTSTNLSAIQAFLTETSTLFTIDAANGKDISEYSNFPIEQEVILMPGTRVRMMSSATKLFGNFSIVHLEECFNEQLVLSNTSNLQLSLPIDDSLDTNSISNESALLLLPDDASAVRYQSKRCQTIGRNKIIFTVVISSIIVSMILVLVFNTKKPSNTNTSTQSTILKTICKPYNWNSTGTIVASGDHFRGYAIDDQFNIYTLSHNRAEIKKWMPGVAQPLTIVIEELPYYYPMNGLFFHSTSNSLYFGDYYNTVFKFDLERNETVKVAFGNGRGSQLNQILTVHDLFVDSVGNIYVLDSFNSRVLKWPVNGTSAVLVAAGGGNGNGTDQLSSFPTGAPQFVVDIDSNLIYIVDPANHRIQQYTIGSTNGLTILQGNIGYFAYPRSVAIDGAGNILVGTYQYIKKYRPGSAFSGIIVVHDAVSNLALNELYDLRFDLIGNLYAIDSQNRRILKFSVTNSSCSSI